MIVRTLSETEEYIRTFVRKKRTRLEGSRGIFPETEYGRALAVVTSERHARRAASHSRSDDFLLLLGEETGVDLVEGCSTSKLIVDDGLPGKGIPSELRLDVDMGGERRVPVETDIVEIRGWRVRKILIERRDAPY